MMAYTCNPSCAGGIGRREPISKPEKLKLKL
jgi:hypothetical protein